MAQHLWQRVSSKSIEFIRSSQWLVKQRMRNALEKIWPRWGRIRGNDTRKQMQSARAPRLRPIRRACSRPPRSFAPSRYRNIVLIFVLIF